MKAITVQQPWAQLIAVGAKAFETRAWKTNYSGPLAIHAGATRTPLNKLVFDACIGNRFYLTRAEAEAALKKRSEE